jgi:hypothetical protein
MQAYSLDFRQKTLWAYDRHLGSQCTLEALFGVSQAFLEKLLHRWRTTRAITPRLWPLRQVVQAQPEATLEAL